MRRLKSPALGMAMILALAPITSPAAAQDAPVATDAPAAAAPVKSEEERAIEAQAAAFSQAMVAMQDELVQAGGAPDESDAIVARYQPAADTLAERINVFLVAHADQPENAERRDELLTQAATAVHRIRDMPNFIRQAIDQAIAAGNAQTDDAAEAPPVPAAPTPADSTPEITPEASPEPSSDPAP